MGTLLTDKEKALFDSINVEILKLAGAEDKDSGPVILWSFTPPIQTGAKDPLYVEPNPRAIYAPFKVKASFEIPIRDFSATDEGIDIRTSNTVWFSRKDLEDSGLPLDDQGDLVKIGDIFELFSQGKKIYFELRVVNRHGFVNDSQVFTQYQCEFVRNDDFIPERKIGV